MSSSSFDGSFGGDLRTRDLGVTFIVLPMSERERERESNLGLSTQLNREKRENHLFPYQIRQQMNGEARAETLHLLSSGYVMLGKQQKCPECGGPLFKRKNGDGDGDVVCPACNVKKEKKDKPEEHPTPAAAPVDTTPELPYNDPCDRNVACERLGELLLKGWRMLAEECPKGCCVPLMQHRPNEPGFCVACLSLVDIQ